MLSCAALWCNVPMGNTFEAAILCIGKTSKEYKGSYVFEREFCLQGTLYSVAALVYQGELSSKM